MAPAPSWIPRVLSVVVFVAMATALGYAAWIAIRYFGQIGV